jgi:hypothetical protein
MLRWIRRFVTSMRIIVSLMRTLGPLITNPLRNETESTILIAIEDQTDEMYEYNKIFKSWLRRVFFFFFMQF